MSEKVNETKKNADDIKDIENKKCVNDEAEEITVDSEETKEKPDMEHERYVRLMAEFQNYKKRVAKEKNDIHAYANEKIVIELLDVLDNFERALYEHRDEAESYAKGMELIFSQFRSVLEKAGLQEIEAIGVEFDPKLHNAVMTEETDEYETGTVCKVMQKGYTLNEKVIRPSMVTVAK